MVRNTEGMEDAVIEQGHATEPALGHSEGRSVEIRSVLSKLKINCLSVTRDENDRGGVTYTVVFEANKKNFDYINTTIIGAGFARRSYSFISDNKVEVVYY